MKKLFTITALMLGLTGYTQISTQTLNTTTSVSATNQTITTYTVLTTNTVLNNANMFDFALTWNIFTPMTNTATGVLRLNLNSMAPNADWFKLSKNLTTNTFDSLRITLSAASTDPTNTLTVDGTTLITTITTNTPQYQSHSVRIINTNTAAASYSLVLIGGLNINSYLFFKDLSVMAYSTSIHSDTTEAPITTGLKSNTDKVFKLSAAGNTIKSNIDNENYKMIFFNLIGNKVFETVLKNEIEVDLNEGIYLVCVFDSENNLIERKRIFLSQ